MMETIAIYWEPQIKTYGIDVEKGVCLLTAALAAHELEPFCEGIVSALTPPGKVKMVSVTPGDSDRMLVHCVTSSVSSDACDVAAFSGMEAINDVELVYFHGPHYGDRYGIAVAAMKALTQHHVPVLSFACSGASVYIVVPNGQSDNASQSLSRAFIVPAREGRSEK